jgi:hypothetical protein
MLTLSNGTKCVVEPAWSDQSPYTDTSIKWISTATLVEHFNNGWRRVWIYDAVFGTNGPEVSVTWQHDTEPTDADSFLMFLASRLPWAGEPLPA